MFVPAYLKSGLHLQALTVGTLFTVLMVGSIAGPVVTGVVADRLGRRLVLLVVYVVWWALPDGTPPPRRQSLVTT